MAAWLSTSSTHKPPDDDHHPHSLHRDMLSGLLKAPSRPHTPLSVKLRQLNAAGSQSGAHTHSAQDPEPTIEEDPQVARFRQLYEDSEAKIASLFGKTGELIIPERSNKTAVDDAAAPDSTATNAPHSAPTSRKRKLDDDYDDYDDDDDDEEDDAGDTSASPLKNKSSKVQIVANGNASPVPRPVLPPSKPASDISNSKPDSLKLKDKPEDARKKLEEAKRLEQETVLNMSRTLFFTLENDRDAMLDQQRLDEAERRAEAEAEGHHKSQNAALQQGSLSQSNLGASSLTLKNLIARIDQRRAAVDASDTELRALMSEVRKNRSKWASEDKVGQEELYEAAEKVLNELKAQTEHSGPFLQPVKKKDAPDYFQVIKLPMDLGTMTKKLKQLAYKSKADFVHDVHLIWTNCLKYNSALDHPMRKHANFMRKETDKLVPLIPDVSIRDRAEVEAEERRQRIADGEYDDNAEDSDDEPIMASRGRKAPAKSAVKQPRPERQSTVGESTPNPESKPSLSQLNNLNGGRAESEADAASQDHSTPPPGIFTPTGLDRGASSVVDGGSEIPDSEVPGLNMPGTPPEIEDDEYRLWKQKTKRERAQVAAARHKLFRGDKLNVDEEALLRNKSRMRRWQHMQPNHFGTLSLADAENSKPQSQGSATLAEGLEPEEESMLPDYYDALAAVPDLDPRLRWEQDADGNVIDQDERFLRLYPSNGFIAPESKFKEKMASNMKQIQETRKIVSKIGVVKQMSLQTQMYQNQFTRYEPAPFSENDIQPHVMTDAGPLMAPWVAKAALTRSIGEVFFHAGFEEFQPSAIDAVADMASDFFQRLASNLATYLTSPKVPVQANVAPTVTASQTTEFAAPVTSEEALLHAVHSTGLSLPDLFAYVSEDLDRTSTRLTTMYERMRSHYADLLRPAVTDETAQGQGSFDSGEQYVAGDFADDLNEDFFGFRELGLDKEFGLVNMTVPLHLLQNRLHTAAAANQQGSEGDNGEKLFPPPPAFPRVNVENVEDQIGLVREFFKRRLRENGDKPLPEDADLPLKQRKGYGRPRIPATGKIESKFGGQTSSPSKKPPPSATKSAAMVRNGSTSGPSGANSKKKSEPNGLSAPKLEATQSNTGTDPNAGTAMDTDAPASPPSFASQLNGNADSSTEKEKPSSKDKDKKQTKTPTKPPLKAKTSLNSGKKDKAKPVTNGDVTMVNGVGSPSETESTPVKEKKDGEGAMISPESL